MQSTAGDAARADKITEKDIDQPVADSLTLMQWSCVPIECTLSATESRDGCVKKCKFVVPRQSYLYHYAYSDTITTTITNEVRSSGPRWFSYRSLLYPAKCDVHFPLPIQYPVHVLCDLVVSEKPSQMHFRPPLCLRVHFSEPKEEDYKALSASVEQQGFAPLPPWSEYLLRYQSVIKLDTVRSGYKWHRHALKEALFARYGSAQGLMLLERDLPRLAGQLFTSVQNNDPYGFWAGKCALEQCSDMQAKRDGHVAVVIHYTPWQKQWILVPKGGQKLGLFLKEKCPPFASLEREQVHSNVPAYVISVQGVHPLLSTPLDDLCELLSSSDLCLHIVLKNAAAVAHYLQV